MGVCCSCGEDPKVVDRDERGMRNPMPPYADWAELLRKDWGSDPTAVSRDYARMRIMVAGPDGPKARLTDVHIAKTDCAAADIKRRNVELKAVTVAISRLVEGPDAATPARIEASWSKCVDALDMEGSPDISRGLHELLCTELQFFRDRNDVTNDATARNPTFNVLLLLAQGTVFYPGQRIAHLLWLPWARHLRDVGWTVYVTDDDLYPNIAHFSPRAGDHDHGPTGAAAKSANGQPTSPGANEFDMLLANSNSKGPAANGQMNYGALAEDPSTKPASALKSKHRNVGGTVSIVHAFAIQNYIDPDDKHVTPAFLIKWAVSITLKKGTGEWVGAAIEQPEVLCEEVPAKRKLMRLRKQQLADAVFNAFGVQMQTVAKLSR
jgi:hypothetical protein